MARTSCHGMTTGTVLVWMMLWMLLAAPGASAQEEKKGAGSERAATSQDQHPAGKAAPQKKPPKKPGVVGEKKPYALQDVVVREQERGTYFPEKLRSATLTDTPLLELPQTVEVIPESMIQEREASTYYDTLQYVSGVFNGGRSPHTRTQGQATIRGFSGSEVSLNGAILPKTMPLFLDAAAIERVEFMKGPIASVFGGQTSALGPYGLGGNVNIVTREPSATPHREAKLLLELGEGQHERLTADINQPFSGERGGFRMALAGDLDRPFYLPTHLQAGKSLFAAPSLAWALSDQVAFRLNTSVQKLVGPSYQGVPVLQGKFVTDYDTYIGNSDARQDYRGVTVQPHLDWKLSEKTSLHAFASYALAQLERTGWGVKTGPPSGQTTKQYYDSIVATGRAPLEYVYGDSTSQNLSLTGYGIHEAVIGPTEHKLVLGADWLRKKTRSDSQSGSTPETDLNHPTVAVPSTLSEFGSESTVDRYGLMFQDQMAWGPVRLLAGLRYDIHESDQDNKGHSWSPRVGVTVLAAPDVGIYGNYSHAEAPNFGYFDAQGEELTDSWRGDQFEVGVKARLFRDLFATAAFFHLQQRNTPEAVPGAPRGVYESGAASRSRGVELSLAGHVTEGWNCWLSYTYINYKNLEADEQIDRFPPHSLALWQTYRFQDGPLRDLQVGAGYRFAAQYLTTFRGAKIGNDYTIPSAHVVDLSLEYPLFGGSEGWLRDAVLRVGVKNLFDKEYVESVRHAPQAFPGQPRTFTVSFTACF